MRVNVCVAILSALALSTSSYAVDPDWVWEWTPYSDDMSSDQAGDILAWDGFWQLVVDDDGYYEAFYEVVNSGSSVGPASPDTNSMSTENYVVIWYGNNGGTESGDAIVTPHYHGHSNYAASSCVVGPATFSAVYSWWVRSLKVFHDETLLFEPSSYTKYFNEVGISGCDSKSDAFDDFYMPSPKTVSGGEQIHLEFEITTGETHAANHLTQQASFINVESDVDWRVVLSLGVSPP